MTGYTLVERRLRWGRWQIGYAPYGTVGGYYQVCYPLWRIKAYRRLKWAMRNPLWIVMVFGDRWQKRARWLMEQGEYIGSL